MGSAVSIQNTHLKKGLAGDGLISERSNRYIRNHMYNHPGRKLSVFISHTHGDNDVELSILHNEILPILRQDALYYGLDVSLIDLYQGLEDIRTADHSILQNHIYAVKKCFFESRGIPHLNHLPLYFLSLQSERYGLIPLPRLLYEKDYKFVISSPSLSRQHRESMNKWYVVDDNSLPPVYVLQALASKDDDSFWKEDYYLLLAAFEHAEQHSNDSTPSASSLYDDGDKKERVGEKNNGKNGNNGNNGNGSKFSVGQSVSEYNTRIALYMSNLTKSRYTAHVDDRQPSADGLGLHWWYRCFTKKEGEAIDRKEDLVIDDREQVVTPYAHHTGTNVGHTGDEGTQGSRVAAESKYDSGYVATSIDLDGTITSSSNSSNSHNRDRVERERHDRMKEKEREEQRLQEAYLQILPYNNSSAFGVKRDNKHVHTGTHCGTLIAITLLLPYL